MTAMKVARCLACVALWVVASGCITSTFVLTDPRYAERPPTRPEVFIDRLPPFPYMSIGVIEVSAPPASDLSQVLAEAASKGGQVGCEVVVERSIHKITSTIPNAGPLMAQAYHTNSSPAVYAPPSMYVPPPPPSKREFICGLRLVATLAPAAAAPRPVPAAPPAAPASAAPPAPAAPQAPAPVPPPRGD